MEWIRPFLFVLFGLGVWWVPLAPEVLSFETNSTSLGASSSPVELQRSKKALNYISTITGATPKKNFNLDLRDFDNLGVSENEFKEMSQMKILTLIKRLPFWVDRGKLSQVAANDISIKVLYGLMLLQKDSLEKLNLLIVAVENFQEISQKSQTEWEITKSRLGMLIPFGFSKDVFDFAGNNFSNLQGLILALKPEDHLTILPGVWDSLLEATDGNQIKASYLLKKLYSDKSISEEIGLDLIISTLLLGLALGFIRKKASLLKENDSSQSKSKGYRVSFAQKGRKTNKSKKIFTGIMKDKQKILMALGFLLIGLMAFFPPWEGNNYGHYRDLGYRFLLDPPELYGHIIQINHTRLLLQIFGTASIFGALFVASKDKK